MDCEDFEAPIAPRVTAIKTLIRECSSAEHAHLRAWMEHAFSEDGFPRAGHDHLGAMSTYSR